MTSRMRRSLSAVAAVGLALLLLAAPGAAQAATDDGDPGDILVTVPKSAQGTEITDAQFRWGINTEAGSGAFAGGCNFLSAGKAGNSGGAVVWTAGSGLYRAQSGDVRIVKPDATGAFQPASFADRCLDPNGDPVSAASLTSATFNQVLIDGGVGRLVPGAGLEIRWKGSFTVVFYGGMTYWSVSDPVLTVDANGRGQVVATASGYGASMEDLTKWEPLKPQSVVLADLRSVSIDPEKKGFATDPLYLGVEVADAGQVARTSLNADYWGAFPSSFVQFQKLTGQAGYWLTTGGQRDRAKVPTTLYVSYDASAPVTVDPPDPGGDDDTSSDPRNVVRERPGTAQSAPQAALPPEAAIFPISDASAVLPQGPGLLSGVLGEGPMSPYALPLLGVLLSLSASIVAVLNIMQLLPWQLSRRGG